jgi:hypothetical protein
VNEFARRFAWWFLALATVAGLYFAAEKAGAVRWFIAVSLGSVILAGVPFALSWSARIRRFPSLLQEVSDLKEASERREERLSALQEELDTRFQAGIFEGQMRIIGSELASQAIQPPRLIAVAEEQGSALLIADIEPDSNILVGARFELRVQGASLLKGVVQVIDVQPETNTATLECVEATVPSFWDHLAERAVSDPAPPAAVHLIPYRVQLPSIQPTAMEGRGSYQVGRQE